MEPFYVGKGKNNRASSHFTIKKKSDNPRKDSIIIDIFSRNKLPLVEYVYQNLTETDAYEKEELLIKLYGRKNIDQGGILSNILISAMPPSQKGKKKIFTESHKQNLSIALKGKPKTGPGWNKGLTKDTDLRLKKSAESRKKTGNKHQIGQKYSQDRIKKIKDKLTGRVIPVEQTHKMSLAKKGKSWEEIYGEEGANIRRNSVITGGKHHNAKKIHTPDGIFETVKSATLFYKLSDVSIRKRCLNTKEKWKDWYYEE
jgi:hypothetical protein